MAEPVDRAGDRDVPAADRRTTCAAVAASGLPGTVHRLDLGALDETTWTRVLRWVEAERLAGLLLAAGEHAGVNLPPARRQAVVQVHRRGMTGVLLLERALLRCAAVLQAAGVELRVLKGSAVARLDYPNPSQREFADVDLMVRPQQFERAVAALAEAGFHRSSTGISWDFDRRFGKGATLVCSDGTQLDLHRTFVTGRFGLTMDLDEVWDAPEQLVVAGHVLQALSPEARLLHAAYHCVLGNWPPRLLPYRDVAEMVLFGRWDDARLRRLSRRWRADAVLATAVREAWQLLGLQDCTALTAWAQHYQVGPLDRRVIALHRAETTSYAAQQLAALGALPWRERLPFAAALALPSREFLSARGTSLPVHVTRSLSRGLRR